MRFATLDEWLHWQEQLHPSEIDLGLERVQQVWARLSPQVWHCPVISVAGTNGKGSSVAMLAAIYHAAGYQVGAYTSPHLWRYNERISVNGEPVDDELICSAFEAIDQARRDVSLTYFEFGTLAALWIFQQRTLDVVILEVGLGGRLDAVNIVDADVALITSIALDHQAWLGETREQIALEKAGILRAQRDAVINDPDPPHGLITAANALGAKIFVSGRDYRLHRDVGQWQWQSENAVRAGLPLPALAGDHQLHNAAGVVMVIELLKARLPISQSHLRDGLLSAQVAGRFQLEQGEVSVIYDVAHNPAAAQRLAQTIQVFKHDKPLHVVFSVLNDKDIAGIVRPFCMLAANWYIAPLAVARAADIDVISNILSAQCGQVSVHQASHLAQSLMQAKVNASAGDVILVFGSFYTVAQACPSRV